MNRTADVGRIDRKDDRYGAGGEVRDQKPKAAAAAKSISLAIADVPMTIVMRAYVTHILQFPDSGLGWGSGVTGVGVAVRGAAAGPYLPGRDAACRGRRPMPGDKVSLRRRHVAADHSERRVAEDLLEAEHVTAVDEVAAREGVAERVRRAARADARPPPKPGDRLLGPALAEGTLPTRKERVGHRGQSPRAEVPDKSPPRRRSQRHDPFLRALADDMEGPVGADVANPQ